MKKNSLHDEQHKKDIVVQLIKKDFDHEITLGEDWEEMRQQLKAFINVLLNKDFERLLQGLYRIDVNEEKVKEILHRESPELMAERLCEMIIKRQKQKAETRLKYSR